MPSFVSPVAVVGILLGDVGVDSGQCLLLIRRGCYRLHNQLGVAIRGLLAFGAGCRDRKFLQLKTVSESLLRVVSHHFVAVTAVTVVLVIIVAVVPWTRWARISGRHRSGWRRVRTFDVLESTFLFRNRNLERPIDGSCVLNG